MDLKLIITILGLATGVAVGLFKAEATAQQVEKNTPRIEVIEREQAKEQAVNAEQHKQILQALIDLKAEFKDLKAEVKSAASLLPRRPGP
jgi:uncharacterized protein YneF (UPF0154 family)